jgi:acyl-coenzyme A thioesterase PaaI-like protein
VQQLTEVGDILHGGIVSTLLDEAMAAAVSGELRPGTSCEIYCRTVGTCHRLGDYRRAGE